MQLTRYIQRFPGYQYPDDVRAVLAACAGDVAIWISEVAARTGLRRDCVAQVAEALETQHLLVAEAGEPSDDTMVCYRLNPNGAFGIGITVDARLLRLAVVNLDRQVSHTASCLISDRSIDQLMTFVADEMRVATDGKGIPLFRIEGICLAHTGLRPAGSIEPTETDQVLEIIRDLQREMSLKYRVPVFVEDQIVAVAHGKAFVERKPVEDTFFYVMLNGDLPCGLFGDGRFQRAGNLGSLPLADFTYNRLTNLENSLGQWVAGAFSDPALSGKLTSVIGQASAYLMMPILTLMALLQPRTVYLGGLPATITAGLCRQLNNMKHRLLPAHMDVVTIEPVSTSDDEGVIGAASLPLMYGLFLSPRAFALEKADAGALH